MSQRGSTRKRGATWTAYWWVTGPDGGRRQRSKGGFAKKTAASAHLTEVLAAVQNGTWSEPTDRRMTVRAYALEQWLPSLDVRPATVAQYRHVTEAWVLPHIGGERLALLTPAHVERMLATLRISGARGGRPLSDRSVQMAHLVSRMMFEHALRRGGYVQHNPVTVVKRPKARSAEMQAWSADEVRTFLATIATDRLRAAWVLFLARGPRRGEVAGMRWRDVDLEAGRWRVVHTRISVGGTVVESTPKTAAGRRTIPLDSQLVAMLRSLKAAQAAERLSAGPAWTDSGYVVVNELGQPYHPEALSDRWEALVKAADVPRIRLHDARHTAATLMLSNGTPTKVASELLGHASPMITQSLYQHVMPGMTESAAEALSALVLGS